MPENERSIKVVDRRLFTADGELTEQARAEIEAPDEPTPPPAAPAAAGAPGGPGAAGAPGSSAQPENVNLTSEPFLRLLDMLAQTAGLYLEGIPDPATGRRSVDLNAARQIVDSIVALREKTRGRLSFEENDALEGLVSELQLVFARMASAVPRGKGPIPPPPTGRRG